MSEKAFQRSVGSKLKALGADVTNHEGQKNIPDMSYGYAGVNGWVEFKFATNYPSRINTNIKWKHKLTPGQRIFLKMRGKRGGFCWILCKVGRDVHLVSWSGVDAFYNGVTRDELEKIAVHSWYGAVDYTQLLDDLIWRTYGTGKE